MTQSLDIPVAQSIEAGRHMEAFGALAGACLQTQTSLVLDVGAGRVRVSPGPQEDAVVLVGESRICDHSLAGVIGYPASLIVPLALRLTQIRLPCRAMLTAGRADRSIADFFFRNVFFAASSGQPITVEPADGPADNRDTANQLRRQYWFLFKHTCPDPLFKVLPEVDAIGHVLMAAVTPIDAVSDPVTRSAAASLRRWTVPAARDRAALAERLEAARRRVSTARGA